METAQRTDNLQQQPAEPVYLENTLLRVFGVSVVKIFETGSLVT
jgi:hypothetical protein